jgi:hypothetical protein
MAKKTNSLPDAAKSDKGGAVAGTAFAKESAENAEKEQVQSLQLFAPSPMQPDSTQFTEKSLSPIVKPRQFPVKAQLKGKFVSIISSPIAEYKNDLMEFVRKDGVKFCFPMVASVKQALGEKPEVHIGYEIIIENTGLKKQGRDTSRKPAAIFRVWISKEPAAY